MPQVNGTSTATADPLDFVDYDPIDHLNALFSHPSTLSTVPTVSASLQRYQDGLDADISSLVTVQTTSDGDSVRRIQDAKAELAELFAKIEGVRERALETERTITEMTADIKRLDSTKRNLTLSMTALKRLQMLTTAYEQLRGMIQSKQYRECAHLLQAVMQLMAHFKSYRSIDQIAALSRNVAELQRELLEQICEDFEVTFARGEVQQKRGMLAAACQVMDALGDHARSRLITWYCNTQLREYRQVFRGNDEAGSLDNISRRYSWFTRMLKTYDSEHAALFPQHWHVSEMLANAFCENTRDDYRSILQKSMRRADGQPPDVNLLLSCLQETLDFEHTLEKRFASGESRSSMDTVTSSGEDKRHGFSQAISEAFEPYLSIWVESQDKQLATLIPKYRQQHIRHPEEEFHSQLVIPSSTELFHQYRVTLAQCAKLSTGGRLLELAQTFSKYLDMYSQQVLSYYLADKTGGPSIEDAIIILNTADYCYQTTNQLEEKIKARIDEDLRDKVDMQSQADSFMGVASAAVRALVSKAEADCAAAWREMRNVPWGKMETVGDQSSYVSYLLERVNERSKEILRCMHKQQYARSYCDNIVDTLANTYITNIIVVRPVSETGAEQMLLDSYVLKKGFSQLATLNADPGTPPNQAFIKRVNQSMAKLDPILKTLQVRSSPAEGLVQAYLIHIRDRSETNFRKMLELKGITKKDQVHLVELFNAHKSSPTNENLQASNPLIASLQLSNQASTASSLAALKDSAVASSTPSLPTRFDPSHFGTALMAAARDAGDRFGSPNLGVGSGANTTNIASRATSPPAEDGAVNGEAGAQVGPANLNENLKNFGKFFQPNTAGFSNLTARFGRRDGSGAPAEKK
ncbi:Vacuolar protein sorting-associated protein 53 [Vermiconidia calcicola]|uniref:Vacuolar protein sorting-associated protein 53 n=1 Tax=Vermiconidia calcicola TaxID=1690605 RepID=A0ACC3NCX3_9PEZI|nr:Vacuolar protein sorting-associated protein 53 [Vermiconidia calcicola]